MDYTQQTREHFAKLFRAIGTEFFNRMAERSLAGDFDFSFSHMQYKHYLETGESKSLLP